MKVKLLALAGLTLLAIGCTNSAPEPQPGPRPDAMQIRGEQMDSSSFGMLLPRGSWWHDERFAGGLALTTEQLTKLDVIGRDSTATISDLRREVADRARGLQRAAEQETFSRAAFDAEARRLSEARSRLLEAEVRHLADTREVLTATQWSALQENIEKNREMRREDMRERRRGGMGGRGGRGGGRRPGGF